MPGSAQGDALPHPLHQALLAELLQVVLLEVAVGAEEYPLGSADLVRFVLNRGQFYLADEVRYLLEPEVRGAAVPVGDRLLVQRVLEGGVERVGDYALPVVVVDLHDVVGLQGLQLVEEQEDQVPLHPGEQVLVAPEVRLAVREHLVRERAFPCERAEAGQEPVALLRRHALVVLVRAHKRVHVQGDVAQPALGQGALVAPGVLEDVFRLVVQDERQEVVLRIVAEVAGLVHENRELPHAKPP